MWLPRSCAASSRVAEVVGQVLVNVVQDDDTSVGATLVRSIEAAALATLRHEAVSRGEVTVALVSGEEIRELNRSYRGIDEETDVLSFGMTEGQPLPTPLETVPYLGDLAISIPRALQQAHDYGHSADREFAFLTVHGVLHLLGQDHAVPDAKRRMRAAEEAVLTALGLPRGSNALESSGEK